MDVDVTIGSKLVHVPVLALLIGQPRFGVCLGRVGARVE